LICYSERYFPFWKLHTGIQFITKKCIFRSNNNFINVEECLSFIIQPVHFIRINAEYNHHFLRLWLEPISSIGSWLHKMWSCDMRGHIFSVLCYCNSRDSGFFLYLYTNCFSSLQTRKSNESGECGFDKPNCSIIWHFQSASHGNAKCLFLTFKMENIFLVIINWTEYIILYTYLGMFYPTYLSFIQIHRTIHFYHFVVPPSEDFDCGLLDFDIMQLVLK
jgi:hypothetical protein